MDFDSDTFQKLIGDCGCGEQYRSWLIHHDLVFLLVIGRSLMTQLSDV